MTVSSYLEAFLSVYGWAMYGVLYLLLMGLGLFLYPLFRIMFDSMVSYMSGEHSDGANVLRGVITSVAVLFFIFATALYPIVPISFEGTTVRNKCGDAGMSVANANKKNNGTYFTTTATHIPVFPWMAMALAQGFNNVVQGNMVCALDLTELQKSMLNLHLGKEEESVKLRQEYLQYHQQCHNKIINKIAEFRNGVHGKEAQNWFNEQTKSIRNQSHSWYEFIDRAWSVTEEDKQRLLEFVDSPLIDQLFFNESGPLATHSNPDIKRHFMVFNADHPVDGYNGYVSPSGTNETADKSVGVPPSCKQWWKGDGGQEGLRERIAKASLKGMTHDVASHTTVEECRLDKDQQSFSPSNLSDAKALTCEEAMAKGLAGGDKDLLIQQILYAQHNNFNQDYILSGGDNLALAGVIASEIFGTSIASKVGIKLDKGTNMLGVVATLYGTVMLIKMVLKFMLPFIMMTIYMFWGVYMVIAALEGKAIVKGMVLIFSVGIIPALWAVVDHLDDKLWDAMYGGWTIRLFDMLILDITSALFSILIFYVVFYLFGLAGGGDAGGALKGGMTESQKLSAGTLKASGRGTKGWMAWIGSGARDKGGNIVSGGWASKWLSKLKRSGK